jgi:hypothetical protein
MLAAPEIGGMALSTDRAHQLANLQIHVAASSELR